MRYNNPILSPLFLEVQSSRFCKKKVADPQFGPSFHPVLTNFANFELESLVLVTVLAINRGHGDDTTTF